MKLFKRLAGACLALTLCCGMAGMAACGDKGGNSGSSNSSSGNLAPQAKENAYNFLVYDADGDAAVGYKVQMCTTDGDAMCYMPSAATDANGYAYITTGASCPAPAVYEVHVLLFNETSGSDEPVELSTVVYTPATFSTEFIEITLA